MVDKIIQFMPVLIKGTNETLFMTFASTFLAYIIGLPLGVLCYISKPNGIRPNPMVFKPLGWIINIGRSVPFIILIILLLPISRIVVGTVIGPKAAVVALVIAASPFVARMIETSLEEMDNGVIEAARTMGASDWQIITKVLLPESLPSLIRGLSIITITIIGYSAMAGATGGGGLGDIAIRYGHHRFESEMTLVTVVLIVIIVQIIQTIFDYCARKIDKKNR